jgi:predicted RNA-binding protein
MHLEIVKHDGPARLGKLHFEGVVVPTPSLFLSPAVGDLHELCLELTPLGSQAKEVAVVSYGSIFSQEKINRFGILPSFPSGYDVPEGIAKEAVERTLEFSRDYPSFGVVVEGGKYVELRERCASELKDRPLLKIADSDMLVGNHRKLVNVVTTLRDMASPNTALYMPDTTPTFFPLLVYMGVDIFDLKRAILGAHENLYFTSTGVIEAKRLMELPCPCSICSSTAPQELIFDKLLAHNIHVFVAGIREVREAIRAGTLRNLVEERAACDVNAMGALRILDSEKQDFLEKYTAVA